MFLTAFLSIAGLGFLCWLAFNLAVYALPFFAAVSVGLAVNHADGGAIASIAAALLARALALGVGEVMIAPPKAPILRYGFALLYAVPAAVAGYSLLLGLGSLGGSTSIFSQIACAAGALVVAAVAVARMTAFARPSVVARQ